MPESLRVTQQGEIPVLLAESGVVSILLLASGVSG